MQTKSNVHPADYLGATLAQIADLTVIADRLKAELKAQGDGAYEGSLFRATVSSYDTENPDGVLKAEYEAVIEKYRAKLSRQYLFAHTVTKTIQRVMVKAKTGATIAA